MAQEQSSDARFEPLRGRLFGIAYRMLASRAAVPLHSRRVGHRNRGRCDPRSTRIVAAVALWSSSIAAFGIANAVLTSVMERVPEIGVQRAVGARRMQIKLEFVTEDAVIGLAGSPVARQLRGRVGSGRGDPSRVMRYVWKERHGGV